MFTSTTSPVEAVGIMESPLPVTSIRCSGAAGILSTNAGGLTSTQPCGSNLTCLRFHVRHPYRIYSFGRHGITGGCYRDRVSRRIISEKHFPFSVVQPVDRNSKICEWLALLIWDALVRIIPVVEFLVLVLVLVSRQSEFGSESRMIPSSPYMLLLPHRVAVEKVWVPPCSNRKQAVYIRP